MHVKTSPPAGAGSHNYLTAVLATGTALVILSLILLASVPPVSRDALTHHLAVPKLYLMHGAMLELPEIAFSYYPMNLDLLYLIPLYFKNDIVPKYIHFGFALLTAALIFSYLKKRISTCYALLGVVFFLSLPVIVRLSITAYVDLGLVFFSTASLIYFLKWIEQRFATRYIVISAVWCGFALGTKYNALIVLFLLTAFAPMVYVRRREGAPVPWLKAVAWGCLFAATALIVFSPWMIRNYAWTRNPVYPLYQKVFQQHRAPVQKESAVAEETETGVRPERLRRKSRYRLGHFSLRSLAYHESWWQIALIPLRIFFEGTDDSPRYFDGRLNPMLLLLPLFAFGGRREAKAHPETEKKVMLWFSVLFIALAFVRIDMRIRYIAPVIPPLVILSVFGVFRINTAIGAHASKWTAKAATALVALVLAALLSLNGAYIVRQFGAVRPFDYLSGRTGRDAYIERYRREYPVFQYINRQLDRDARILCGFLGNRIYYCDRKTVSNWRVFGNAVVQADSPEQILQRLKQGGITHLMLRIDLFDQWLEDNCSEAKRQTIKRFFHLHATPLYHKYVYGLFALR